jgi:hypothetical protein
MTTEADIRADHHALQDAAVGGHGSVCRCSCGATWYDGDLDCPVLDAALEALAHARMDDDGWPAR